MNLSYLSLQSLGYGLVLVTNVLLLFRLVRRGFLSAPTGVVSDSRFAASEGVESVREPAQGPSAKPERVFALAVAFSVAWGLAGVLGEELRLQFWAWLALLADVLRYGAWMAFLLLVLYPGQRAAWRRRPMVWVAALVLGAGMVGAVLDGWLPHGLGQPLVASALALAVVGLVLLEQVFRNQPSDSTWNIKPICIGLAFGFAYDVFVFSEGVMFGRIDRDLLDIRGLIHALATPLLYLASQRHRSWVQRIQLSRNAVFYSATLLLIGVYLLFIAGVGYYIRYFGGSWGRALQVAVLAAALLALAVVVLSTSTRARLRVFLGKHLFTYRFDYREEWLRFTSQLSAPASPSEVGALVIRGLADMVECPGGSLWTQDLAGGDFVPSAQWKMAVGTEKEATDSSLCQLLREREWIVDIDEFRSHPRRYGDLVLPMWLATHPTAWLVVPLLVGGRMIGFVVLAKPRTPVDLNWEVRDLLKTAARQAAVFLAQMHATEALLEARKFDAFNRMSAFVVHDLKNIITQLSLMLKNAQRHGDNPEFQPDMLLTVESSLDKMRQMMAQLREGQKPAGRTSGVDLQELLLRLKAMAQGRGRDIGVDIVDVVATRGHEQRLERVLGHVVQNALDATPLTGQVSIRLERDAGRARIVVADNGVGMTPEFIRSQLFRPFNTTKESGMGIGSYESYQYVKELGGSLEAQSEVGKGTAITILLPLLDTQTRSDLTTPGELGS